MYSEDCWAGVLETSGWPVKAEVATRPQDRRRIDRTMVRLYLELLIDVSILQVSVAVYELI